MPVTRRHKKFTPKLFEKIIATVESGHTVKTACKRCGISHACLYNNIKGNVEQFDRLKEAILAGPVFELENEAHRRAFKGCKKPVFYKGSPCGHILEFSDTLLIFLLKAARPEVYRDNTTTVLTGANGGPLQIAAEPVVFLEPNGFEATAKPEATKDTTRHDTKDEGCSSEPK